MRGKLCGINRSLICEFRLCAENALLVIEECEKIVYSNNKTDKVTSESLWDDKVEIPNIIL